MLALFPIQIVLREQSTDYANRHYRYLKNTLQCLQVTSNGQLQSIQNICSQKRNKAVQYLSAGGPQQDVDDEVVNRGQVVKRCCQRRNRTHTQWSAAPGAQGQPTPRLHKLAHTREWYNTEPCLVCSRTKHVHVITNGLFLLGSAANEQIELLFAFFCTLCRQIYWQCI